MWFSHGERQKRQVGRLGTEISVQGSVAWESSFAPRAFYIMYEWAAYNDVNGELARAWQTGVVRKQTKRHE